MVRGCRRGTGYSLFNVISDIIQHSIKHIHSTLVFLIAGFHLRTRPRQTWTFGHKNSILHLSDNILKVDIQSNFAIIRYSIRKKGHYLLIDKRGAAPSGKSVSRCLIIIMRFHIHLDTPSFLFKSNGSQPLSNGSPMTHRKKPSVEEIYMYSCIK